MVKYKKVKDIKKVNSGNKTPRTKSQIDALLRRMLFDNPLKKPLNRINQSQRMYGNKLWRQRKKWRIKQEPSVQVDNSKEKSETHN